MVLRQSAGKIVVLLAVRFRGGFIADISVIERFAWEGIPVRILLRVRRFSVELRHAASIFSRSGCRKQCNDMVGGPVDCPRRWIRSRWHWVVLQAVV